MAKFNQIKNTFLFGEVSPRFYGRTEVEDYNRSCRKLKNTIVYPQGGASRRVGTQFKFALDATKQQRIIPFTVSESIKYLIILTSDAYKSYDITDDTAVVIDESGNNNAIFNYTDAELNDVQFVQKDTLLFLTHQNKPTLVIQKDDIAFSSSSHGIGIWSYSWEELVGAAVGNRKPWESVPYEPNLSDAEITPTGTTSTITLNISTGTGVFTQAMEGDGTAAHMGATWIKINSGYCIITNFITNIQVTAEVFVDLSGTTPTTAWDEGIFGLHRGHPRTCALFEQRLYFGGITTQPDTVFASQTGDLLEMDNTKGTDEDNAFNFTISSDRIDQIQWMSSAKVLNIGTLTKEYIARGTDNALSLSTSNVSFSPETEHGSSFIQATRAEGSPIFITRNNQRAREFIFNFNEDNYQSTDLTLWGEHIINRARDEQTTFNEAKIKFLAHQENDNGIIWMVDNNGGLIGITRNRQHSVLAMHHHFLGGNFGGELPVIESIAIMTSTDNTHDDVWLAVKRTINSLTVRHLEKMGKELSRDDIFNTSTDIKDKLVYSDSAGLKILGSPGTSFSGFTQLASESVDVVADGKWIGQHTVSAAGVITTVDDHKEVVAGHNYVSQIIPQAIEAGSQIGSAQGTIKRVDRMNIRFNRTIGAKFGKDLDSLESIIFRPFDLPMDDAIPLFTGEKAVLLDDTYSQESLPVIVQDLPLPMGVTNVVFEGETYD